MDSIKIFYKFCPNIDLRKLEQEGGLILDVRSSTEFNAGHIQGSINISLEELQANLHRIPDRNQMLVICCSTGMKSASAKVLLESLGYTHVCNGGSWRTLQEKLSYEYTQL